MKKTLLFASMLIAGASSSFGQLRAPAICTPDPAINTNVEMIQVLPDTNVSLTGTASTAFSLVVTVFTPDTVKYPLPAQMAAFASFLTSAPGGKVTASIDSIKITGVTGLPAGLTLDCGSCVVPANQPGCLKISGTLPSTNNLQYKLVVTGTPHGQLDPAFIAQVDGFAAGMVQPEIENNTFAQNLSMATYKVNVGTVGIEDFSLQGGLSVDQNMPNPFDGSTTINFNTTIGGTIDFIVTDVLGRQVYDTNINATAGSNTFVFTTDLANGTYFFSLSDGTNTVTHKMVISE